jgi:hypothetical protein
MGRGGAPTGVARSRFSDARERDDEAKRRSNFVTLFNAPAIGAAMARHPQRGSARRQALVVALR